MITPCEFAICHLRARHEHGESLESVLHSQQGGGGPEFNGMPAYHYDTNAAYFFLRGEINKEPIHLKYGEIGVELHWGNQYVHGIFKIRDLWQEVINLHPKQLT